MKSVTRVCGMVLSTLTSEKGQPTGLSLACSSSAIAEALQQIKSASSGDPKTGNNHIMLSECNYLCSAYPPSVVIYYYFFFSETEPQN